jgi:hypothetical protein
MIGTYLMDRAGRKALCVFASVGMILTLFIVGALTKSKNSSKRIINVYKDADSKLQYMANRATHPESTRQLP